MKVNCDRARGARFCWCLGVVVAACLTPVEVFAPTSVAVQVGGDAWATGNNCEQDMARSDQYCDSDGDGIPDKDDPCPNEPNPNCESMTVYGDRSYLLPVTCSDGTRVADVRDCPNYRAPDGSGNNGNDADSESGNGGRRDGGGGGGSDGDGDNNDENMGIWVRLEKPDVQTKPLEPIARAIDSCVHQGHADFRDISYVLGFRKITVGGQRALGVADAITGKTFLDIEEIARGDYAGTAWKSDSAITSVHELLHHRHPDWTEDQVRGRQSYYGDLAERCASEN